MYIIVKRLVLVISWRRYEGYANSFIASVFVSYLTAEFHNSTILIVKLYALADRTNILPAEIFTILPFGSCLQIINSVFLHIVSVKQGDMVAYLATATFILISMQLHRKAIDWVGYTIVGWK